MKKQWMLGALAVFGVGCDVVLGIEPAVPCVVDGDCLVQTPECATVKCDAGQCKYQYTIEGTPIQKQVLNDCELIVCNGAGGVKSDPFDDADDGNPCTSEECKGGKVLPSVPITGVNVACYSGEKWTRGVGRCREGTIQCNNGQPTGKCEGEVLPNSTGEVCLNGVDDDCDGSADENFEGCACGDGILTPEIGEECDDGGTADGDDCSPTCKEQRVLQVTAGTEHTCALLSGNQVKCWGDNSDGQLGIGANGSRGFKPGQMGAALPAVDLGSVGKIIEISAERNHTCVLFDNGRIKCWGENIRGELGLGDSVQRGYFPAEMGDNLPYVDLGSNAFATAISAGGYHTCALLSTKKVKCWGAGGAFGLDPQFWGDEIGEMGDALPTVDWGPIAEIKSISAGHEYVCALLATGQIKCCGHNQYGELGLGDTIKRSDPSKMGSQLPIVDLGYGEKSMAIYANGHTCVLLAGDRAKCWGPNSKGELGLGDTMTRGDASGEMGNTLPVVDIGNMQAIKSIVVGQTHSCALDFNGNVKCWGDANMLGLGANGNNFGDQTNEMGLSLPTVELGHAATAIAAGDSHTCAILSDGSLKCWGYNGTGALGLGDTETRGDSPGEMGDNLPTVKLFSDVW